MARQRDHGLDITPELLLRAYAAGIFPMAESADDPALYWVEPRERGIIPLDGLPRPLAPGAHRALATSSRSASTATSTASSPAAPPRPTTASQTWINARIRDLYGELFDIGHAHTVEAWQDGTARRRPLRRAPRRGVLRREHVPHRARRLEGGARPSRGAAAGRRLPPARHAVRDAAPRPLRRGGGSRAATTASCSTPPSFSMRISTPGRNQASGARRRSRRWSRDERPRAAVAPAVARPSRS